MKRLFLILMLILSTAAPAAVAISFSDSGQSLGSSRSWGISAADLDGDGDFDFVSGNHSSQGNVVWLNDGAGSFSSSQSMGADSTRSLGAADLDNDGDIDLIFGNDNSNKIWLNDGAASFTDSGQSIGQSSYVTYSLDHADYDSDGDIDFTAMNKNFPSVVWLNDGTGTMTDSGNNIPAANNYAIQNTDVDGDGDIDIIQGIREAGNRVWLNDGSAGFTDSSQSMGLNKLFAMSVCDVNGDGSADILEGTNNEGSRIWTNDGSGFFTNTGQSLTAAKVYGTEVGDMDGDGDCDFVEGVYNAANKVYLNDGTGNYSDSGLTLGSRKTVGLAVADIDNSGDLDIIAGNIENQDNRVWMNDTDHANTVPVPPSISAEPDIVVDGATFDVTLDWATGSDAETTDTDLLTYDIRIGTSSGGCETFCGTFPSNGSSPYLANYAGNIGQSLSHKITLPAATYYWSVRTVDQTFSRSAWSAEDSFQLVKGYTDTGQNLGMGSTWALATADFDADGDFDIVDANADSEQDTIWMNDGAGSFFSAQDFGSSKSHSIDVADMDGDGDVDVIIGTLSYNKLWLNDGSASFSDSGEQIGSGVFKTYSIIAADIDSDGDIDVVSGNKEAKIETSENDGSGNFSDGWTGTEDANTYSVDTADVDNDGDLDILEGIRGSANNVWLNDGSGAFATSGQSLGSNATYQVFSFDADADGDPDFIEGNYNEANIIWTNDGSGSFADSGQTLGSAKTFSVFPADYDGDGDYDIIAGNSEGQPNSIWKNDGSGVFSDAGYAMGANETFRVVAADIDGDDDLDIIEAASGEPNKIWRNNLNYTNNTPSAPSVTDEPDAEFSGASTYRAVLEWTAGSDTETTDADLLTYDLRAGSSSGACDVFCGRFPSTGATPWTGSGFGNSGTDVSHAVELPSGTYYWSVRTVDSGFNRSAWSAEDSFTLTADFIDSGQTLSSGNTSAVYSADFDGDGDFDFVEANMTGGQDAVWTNDGAGSFTSAQSFGSSDSRAVTVADTDMDGDLDIILGTVGYNEIWLNDGSSSFSDSGQVDSSYQVTFSIKASDVDSDGDPDIVLGNKEEPLKIWLNNGAGSFSYTGQSLGNAKTYSIALSDLDADGDMDLIDGVRDAANTVWLNDGDGAFSDSGQTLGANSTFSIFPMDVDGDGDTDFTEANYNQANKVWLNDGAGSFSDSGQSLGSKKTFWNFGGDLDGDGDFDIIAANGEGQANTIWLNDGAGVFSDAGLSLGSWRTYSVFAVDIDGDSDLDIIEGNNNNEANRIWINNLDPSLSSPSTPSVTGEADVVVQGSSSMDITLEWSAGADAETTDPDLLAYDIRIGTTSGGCETLCGRFPSNGSSPYLAAGPGAVVATSTYTVTLGAGTYYWSARTVDATYSRSAWSAEDEFTIKTVFSDAGASLGSGNTLSIAPADLDGDGDLDFFAGNYSSQPDNVWLNDGAGGFALSESPGSDQTRAAAAADFDNDGDIDIFTGIVTANKVWLNDGSASFTDSGQSLGSLLTYDIDAADLDADGDIDLLDGNRNGANAVWLNDGGASFSDSGQEIGSGKTYAVEIADIDNDGDFDIIDGCRDEPVGIWLNSFGTFTNSGLSLGSNSTFAVNAADVDADGDMDFIESNYGQGNAVWLNNGSGSFSDSGQSLGTGKTFAAAVFDADGDGDFDYITGNNEDEPDRYWINDGSGSFTDSGLTMGDSDTAAVAALDIDGDFDVDFIQGNYAAANRVWLYNLSNSNTAPSAPSLNAAHDAYTLFRPNVTLSWGAGSDAETADADLLTYDLRLGTSSEGCEVFCGGFTATGSTSWTGAGPGNTGAGLSRIMDLPEGTYYWSVRTVDPTFRRSAWSAEDTFDVKPVYNYVDAGITLGNMETIDIHAADFDADGDIDFTASNYSNQENNVWTNDGSGSFTLAHSLGSESTRSAYAADVDADGDLDIISGNLKENFIWINNMVTKGGAERIAAAAGVLGFTDSGQRLGSLITFSVDAVDVDLDGDIDFIDANKESSVNNSANKIWINDGAGNYSDSGQNLGQYKTYSIHAIDVDLDGDIDFLEGNRNDGNRVWLNNSRGIFSDSGQSLGANSTIYIFATDVDGDRDPDFMEANFDNEPNYVWINDGSGNYSDSGQRLGAAKSTSLFAADLDIDGDYDYIVGNGEGDPDRIYLNDGNGVFQGTTEYIGTQDTISVHAADVDGDGDLDFIEGNNIDGNRVFLNDLNTVNNAPTAPSISAAPDVWTLEKPSTFLDWSAGSDPETADSDLLTYDIRIGTSSSVCDVYCGFFPSGDDTSGLIGRLGTRGFGESWRSNLKAGTYYWSVRTVDPTYKRSAWSAEDSFVVMPVFTDSGQALGNNGTYSTPPGDLDSDGDLDFVEGNYFDEPSRIWLNNGSGSYTDSGQLLDAREEENWMRLSMIVDVEGDGDLDFVAGNLQGHYIWLNDGNAVFTDSMQSLGSFFTFGMDIADIDGDGDMDLICGNRNEPNRLWENDGRGRFATVTQEIGENTTWNIAAGDLDGDGDYDFIESNRDQADKIWLNDGDGVFSDSGQSLGAEPTLSGLVMDIDGDSDLDYIAGNYDNEPNTVWLNDGNASFSDTGQQLGSRKTIALCQIDVEADGDYDFIAGNTEGQANKVWLNDGGGNFVDTSQELGSYVTLMVHAADVDNDGDQDFIEANSGNPLLTGAGEPNRIWLNNMNYSNQPPASIVLTDEPDVVTSEKVEITLEWSASSDDETPDPDLITYDVRIGTTSGGCELYCGLFPAKGVSPYLAAGPGAIKNQTSLTLTPPAGTYYWAVRAVDSTFKRGAWSAFEDEFTLTDTGLPELEITYPSSGDTVGGTFNIQGTIDDFSLDSWTLYYGAGANPSNWVVFSTGTFNIDNTTIYTWDSSALSGLYTLKLEAVDTNSNMANTSVTITIDNSPTISGTLDYHKWYLLATPVNPSPSDPLSMFGTKNLYKVYRWNPNASEYDQYLGRYEYPENLAAGQSFWIKTYNEDLEYSYSGPVVNTTGEYTMQLYEGWNQVGTPYMRDFPWGQAQVRYESMTYNLADAVDAGLLADKITAYDQDLKSWIQINASGMMEIKKGYSVRAYADVILIFDPSAVSLMRATSRLLRRPFDYNIRLSASSGDVSDLDNFFGASSKAETEFDGMDFPEPHRTPADDYISLYFDNGQWSRRAGRYANDIRQSASSYSTEDWHFKVDTNVSGEPVTLTWDCDAIPGERYTFTLVHVNTGAVINMSEQCRYKYQPAAGDTAPDSFRIEVLSLFSDPVSVSYTLEPGWNLMSVPVDPQVTGALEQLGDDLSIMNVYQFFDGRYYAGEDSDIEAGFGYWIHVDESAEIDILGIPVPANMKINVPLAKGWNIIGNPYNSALRWGNNISFECNGKTETLDEAAATGTVDSTLYLYGTGGYIHIEPGDELEPWKGYFLRAGNACNMVLAR